MTIREGAIIIKLKVKEKTLMLVHIQFSYHFGGSVNCYTFLRSHSMNITSIIKLIASSNQTSGNMF